MRTLFISFLLLLTTYSFAQPYRNLVLEGGGIRGIAYAGALKAMEENGLVGDIENIAGTSVGALVGALYSVGYTADEMKAILNDLEIEHFNDGKWFFIGGQKRLRKRYGWYRGEELEKWLDELIERKTGDADITFKDLSLLHRQDATYKNLHVVATNLSQQKMEVFNHVSHPDMKIKTAVRASISIPMYFGAVFIDGMGNVVKEPEQGKSYNVYVDGGILGNYPLQVFDSGTINMHTLGLKLERPEQLDQYDKSGDIAPYHIDDFRTYIGALYNVIIEGLNRNEDYETEKLRTIYISTGKIGPRIKHTSEKQKLELYDNGKAAVNTFVKAKL